ncbi:MAG TPA: NosD domain-containing protein [Lysobacter sp.]
MLRPLILLALLAVGILVTSARAAEGYANCTGFVDTLPATISTQGVWCLRHDVSTAVTSGNAITIATNNVTLDCNDFKVGGLAAGTGSTAKGIYAVDRLNITVRRCNVRGFRYGIHLDGSNGSGHLVEDNRLDFNLHSGIVVGGRSNRVQRNRVHDTGGANGSSQSFGLFVAAHAIDNTVDGVFAAVAPTQPRGIYLVGDANEARGNLVRGLVVDGAGAASGIIVTGEHATVSRNRVIASVPVNGTGIIGHGTSNTFCTGNLVANFALPWNACQLLPGNDSH